MIVALDGQPVKNLADLTVNLRNKAGRQVLLELRSGNEPLRKVVVTPAPAAREADYKRQDWVWQRRERVEAASKGRFGYLHLRAMGARDINAFARDFYANINKEGLIIDVRRNNGGNIDSWIIEKLLRLRRLFEAVRYSDRQMETSEEQAAIESLRAIVSFMKGGTA